MATHGAITIFPNAGGSTIISFATQNDRVCTLSITDSGLSFKSLYNGVEDDTSTVWSYDGSKKFLGLSKTKNSSVVDEGCGIGNTISFDNMESEAFYIVEGEVNTSTITNLTNTTWYLSEWSYSGTQQEYYVSGKLTAENTSKQLSSGTVLRLTSSAIVIDYMGLNTYTFTPNQWFTFEFDTISTYNSSYDLSVITTLFNDYGTQLKVTDLTNTTWYVPSGWSARSGYGHFSIAGTYVKNSTSEASFNSFSIGYLFDGPDEVSIDSWVAFDTYGIDTNNQFSLTITGGTDITNPKLIAWLETYGTQLKVTNLTNTTWKINSTECVAGYGKFSLDMIVFEQSIVGYLGVGYSFDDSSFSPVATANSVEVYNDSDFIVNKLNVGKTFTITGGDDVTNPKLIAWLSKWGELEGGEEEKIPTLTYDLLQLDLSAGTHIITVITKADGYADSEPSNAVEYVVESSFETVPVELECYQQYGQVNDTVRLKFGTKPTAANDYDYSFEGLTTSITPAVTNPIEVPNVVYIWCDNGTMSRAIIRVFVTNSDGSKSFLGIDPLRASISTGHTNCLEVSLSPSGLGYSELYFPDVGFQITIETEIED